MVAATESRATLQVTLMRPRVAESLVRRVQSSVASESMMVRAACAADVSWPPSPMCEATRLAVPASASIPTVRMTM